MIAKYKKGEAQPDLITRETSSATDFFIPNKLTSSFAALHGIMFFLQQRRDKCCCSGKLMLSLLEILKNENFPADKKRIMKQQGKPSPTLQQFNFIFHVLDVERCHLNSSQIKFKLVKIFEK